MGGPQEFSARKISSPFAAATASDSGIGLLQLRLTEFDDRTQAKLIRAMGETQAEIGFPGELGGNAGTPKCGVAGEPCSANIPHDPVAQIPSAFRRSFGPEVCFRSSPPRTRLQTSRM